MRKRHTVVGAELPPAAGGLSAGPSGTPFGRVQKGSAVAPGSGCLIVTLLGFSKHHEDSQMFTNHCFH